jgi:hypothetical protein
MLRKDYDDKGLVEEIFGGESQGAWRQDELIDGKKASRKLTLTLTLRTFRAIG